MVLLFYSLCLRGSMQNRLEDRGINFYMDNEIWKDIDWYDGLYQISNIGRVRNSWKIMSHWDNWKWYSNISLTLNWVHKTFKIHHIVARSFLPISDKKEINHKNWIKSDNRVENLEWCTRWENIKHAYSTWLRINANRWNFWIKHPNSKPIEQISLQGNVVRKWSCAAEASRELGFDDWLIWKCCKNGKASYWFKWSYLNISFL